MIKEANIYVNINARKKLYRKPTTKPNKEVLVIKREGNIIERRKNN